MTTTNEASSTILAAMSGAAPKKSLEELMGLMNQAKNNLASHEPSD